MSEENINDIVETTNAVPETVETAGTAAVETAGEAVTQAADTAVEAAEPVYQQAAPAPVDWYVPNADQGDQPPKKKKKKGLKIALIVVLAIVVIIGATIAIAYATNKEYVQNKWALLTKSDEEYLKWVADKKVQAVKTNAASKLDATKTAGLTESFTSNGKISFSLSSELGKLVLGKSFTGIEKAGLEYLLSVENNNRIGVQLTPFYKDTDIISVAGVYDINGDKAYVSIPSYKSEIISLEKLIAENKDKIDEFKKQIEKNIDLSGNGIAESINKFKGFFTGDSLDKLVGTILDKTGDVSMEKNINVRIGNLEGEFNIISGTVKKEDIQQIIKSYTGDILNESSSALEDMIKAENPDLPVNADQITDLKNSLDKALKSISSTAEIKVFVDNKGNIAGASIKLTVDKYPITVKWISEENKDDASKTVTASDILVQSFVLANITCETQKTDTLQKCAVTIKPGAFVASLAESMLEGVANYVLKIDFTDEKKSSDTNEHAISLVVTNGSEELAYIRLNGTTVKDKVQLPIDIYTNSGKVIDLYDVPNSDYIDVTLFGRQIFGKLDEINDPNFNNFLNGLLESTGMSLDTLREMVETGNASIADNLLKKKLRELLGIPEPYAYDSITEAPKSEDGKYMYSWDILKDTSTGSVSVAGFNVYDHFREPTVYVADLESEKSALLLNYADQVYAYDAEAGSGIEMGDKIVFDAVPIMFGVPMESYAYAGNNATIGKYEYGAGIDDKLLGMQAGQTKDIDLTLDERYGDFAGYSGTFRITVTKIQKTFGPEWSERFIVGELGYESLEACETYLLAEAEKKLPEPEPEPTVWDIKSALLDEAVFKASYTELDEETKSLTATYFSSVESKGTYFLQELYGANHSLRNQDEKNRIVSPTSDYKLKRSIFCAGVAYKSGISFDSDELDTYYDKLAEESGYTSGKELKDKIVMYYGERFMVDFAIERAVCDLLYENSIK